jgi:two-component system chemotaxis response regulator CheY
MGLTMRTLVVEDDAISRKVLTGYLAQISDVVVAENGVEGTVRFIEALGEGKPFDLVCLDIMMPELDGHSCLKLIRQAEEEFGIFGLDCAPVLMTTCVEQPAEVLGAFKSGCDGYLVKPVDRRELIAKVESLKLSGRRTSA